VGENLNLAFRYQIIHNLVGANNVACRTTFTRCWHFG